MARQGSQASRRARPLLLAVLAAVVVPLTACTGVPAGSTGPDWEDRSAVRLRDPDGLGSGSGGVPGSVELGETTPGHWVVYAACTGAESVRLSVRTGAERPARATVVCGRTTRLPITIGSGEVVALSAEPGPRSGAATTWFAAIDGPAWMPPRVVEG